MKEQPEPKSAGRLKRHRQLAQEIYHEPRSAGTHLRTALLTVWVQRGAGLYGLGWIVALIVLEVDLLTSEILSSEGVFEFIGGQLLEYVLRLGFMSFVNSFLALLWPVYVLQWMPEYGVFMLFGAYFVFEMALRPGLERVFPELAQARAAALARKAALKAKKAKKSKKT